MERTIAYSLIYLFKRLSMAVVALCLVYIFFFLIFPGHDRSTSEAVHASKKAALIAPAPVLDLKPLGSTNNFEGRDVFSLSPINTSGAIENTPKGQLPSNLKVVGIVVARPSQIIIEDSLANQTYFIDEGTTQAGIRIKNVERDQMTINFRGEDIPIPVTKD